MSGKKAFQKCWRQHKSVRRINTDGSSYFARLNLADVILVVQRNYDIHLMLNE